ncbi:MAG: bifunctional glycosyltransferase family 2/GtrA family protein [Spirochaetaceae bacterium]|nr:bifunctional glycosyltransferase family 2/GtrA family protein [Spirochaetaceae bacterium]
MHKLSLIIPCYNEEKTLANIVERCLSLISDTLSLELVIVNDCSTDNSDAAARNLVQQYSDTVKYFSHEKNMGKGAALRTGFLKATGDFVGIQDADMEYNPEDYLTMLEPLIDGRADVVYGSRYLLPDTRRVLYWWHTRMNKSLTAFSNMFTNLDITDMETCYKLFRRDVIQEIAPNLKENRFGFEPEVTAAVARGGCRVYECAIHYNPRTVEEGKKINWKDGVRALYCIMHYSASTAPVPMQLILYFFIGTFSAICNLIAFFILGKCGIAFTPSVITAFIISALINYLLCISILFRHKARWSSGGEFLAYIITLVIMGGFDWLVTSGLISVGMTSGWAKAVSSIIGFFGNYLFRRVLVFPEKKVKK